MADTFVPKKGLTYTTTTPTNKVGSQSDFTPKPGLTYSNTYNNGTKSATTFTNPTQGNSPVNSGGASSGGSNVGQSGSNNAQSFDQDSINAAIDNIYNSSYDYLNQAEGALRSDLPNVLNEAQSNYDTNASILGNSRTSGLNQLGEQGNQAGQQNQNALGDARRLYNDLRTGYQQRFGGASSAGDAAFQLASVEQQRQQGQIGQQYQQTLRQIDNQKADVESKYNDGLLQLQQQKQSAINQANRDFQQKLLDITNNRAQIGAAKSQAKLQALQELRNQVYNINLQNQQFQSTLDQQRQQATGQLAQYAQSVSGATTAGGQAVQGFNPQVSSNLQSTSVQPGNAGQNPYVGALAQKRPEDQFNLPTINQSSQAYA